MKYRRILDAAVEVIAERGYFHSPVNAIARRAGVADGTIYLYFKSKDEVLRAAIDMAFDQFSRQMEEAFETLRGPREQLEYIAQAHMDRHASMAIHMQREVRPFLGESSQRHLAKYIEMVREVIRRGQQEGVFRRDMSDEVVAHFMFGVMDELLSSAVFAGLEGEDMAGQVVDVLFRGIGA